jgi:DNA-sulfur modification-associated
VAAANKESTDDLIENDGVLKMPRMKNFLKFLQRVMDNVEGGKVTDGFLGSVSMVLPKSFTGARLEILPLTNLPDDSRIGVFKANPTMGESILHIADGQGRIVGFHSLERELVLKIVKLKDAIKKIERKGLPAADEKADLVDLEKALERVRKFLSETDMSFICYAHERKTDNTVVGLGEDAEKRCYIEGNAYNSMASKEDIIKYEQFSPIVVDLQTYRDEHDWMDEEFIEDDSKSISSSSLKLFTLSALVQAYSWGLVNDNKPLKNVDLNLQSVVDKRKAFCHAFWDRITNIFEPVWLPKSEDGPATNATFDQAEHAAYLKQARQIEKNVTFQAIFLQALGRLCYAMGKKAEWDPNSPLLLKLDQLSPRLVEYRAVPKYHFVDKDTLHVDQWNDEWTRTMMKQSIDKTTGKVQGYAFNNASENISATRHLLASKIGLDDKDIGEDADISADPDVREAA